MTDSRQQKGVNRNPRKNPGLWRDVLTEDDSFVCGLLGEEKRRFLMGFGPMVTSHLQPAPVFCNFLRRSVLGYGNMWEWSAFYISVIEGKKKKSVRSPREKTTYR